MRRPNTGVVFLDDVHASGAWHDDRSAPWRRGRGLCGPLLPPTIEPPPGVVVVARSIMWRQLSDSAAWLSLARRVAIVLDTSDELDRRSDPDDADLLEIERNELTLALANLVELIEVADPAGIEGAVDRALTLVEGEGAWSSWTTTESAPEAPPGPWLPWSPGRAYFDGALPRLGTCLRYLAAQLHRHEGRPSLLDSFAGERLDLVRGDRVPVPELVTTDRWRPAVAAAPDGGWLGRGPSPSANGGPTWSIGRGLDAPWLPGGYGDPVGVDPTGRLAWNGARCTFDWRVVGPRGPAFWTTSSHRWPDGHAKKLYGYENNEPLWVHVATDARACLSVFGHDALITPGLPLRWRDVGGLAVAERVSGEPRALLFLHSAVDDDAYFGDPKRGDEDTRDRFATVTLGPSEGLRYVVGLDASTWRVRGERGRHLGESAPAWIVFDARHERRHRGEGRLLAGWHEWVVFEREGRLRRAHLTSGSVEDLGPSGREVSAAVALPGTPNVLLVSASKYEAHLRLV